MPPPKSETATVDLLSIAEEPDVNSTDQQAGELLVDAKIVSPEKLRPLRDECDELTAIFVTILKRGKE